MGAWRGDVSSGAPEVSNAPQKTSQTPAPRWQRFAGNAGLSAVRLLRDSLAISVAVHVAALGLAWLYDPPARTHHAQTAEPAPTPIEVVPPSPPAAPESAAPEPPPLEVAILDPETTARISALPPPTPPEERAPRTAPEERAPTEPRDRPQRRRDRAEPAAIETGHRPTPVSPGGETAPGPGTPAPGPGAPGEPGRRSPLLSMRDGETRKNVFKGLKGTELFDSIDHVPAGTNAVREVESTGLLDPAGGGSYRSNLGPVSATVAPDGSVSLRDNPNVSVRLAVPRPKQVGRGVADWYESDKGPDGKRGKQTLADKVNGSIDEEDRSQAIVVPVLGGSFDTTDALMRAKGIDPYAAMKLKYLDSTRDERAQIGAKYRADQLDQTSLIMKKNLDRLWATVHDPAARKQALFELWDEVVERGDAKVVAAGAAARRLVIGFIRARLPAGSPEAYTTDELAAFNRKKQSQSEFAPY